MIVIASDLPNLSGYDVSIQLRKISDYNTKIILLADKNGEIYDLRFNDSSADSWAMKSPDYAELIEEIKRQL